MKNDVINLKDNMFITLLETVPYKAKMRIAGKINFVNEEESRWYVGEKVKEDGTRYVDYADKNREHHSAKMSLISAIQKLAGPNIKIEDLTFKIFNLN